MAEPVTKGSSKELARVGWGAPFRRKITGANVVNLAVIGASVRSYTNDGVFQQIIDQIEEGDWMICQFGHNELGGYHSSDSVALPGIGPESETITNQKGGEEVIYTYGGYLSRATLAAQDKGAKIMILSQTPEVEWSQLSVTPKPATRFVQFAHDIASSLGVQYYDHYQAFADYLTLSGPRKSASFFIDNRHMNKVGAQQAVALFLQWLRENDSELRHYIGDEGGDPFKRDGKRSRHVSYTSHRGHKKRRLSQY